MIDSASQREIQLSPNIPPIKPIGIGTWAWGDKMIWGYGKEQNTEEDFKEAFDYSTEAGITFFDTAEVYGSGLSESILGRLIPRSDKKIIVGTKFMPYPWRLTKTSFQKALEKSLARLGLKKVELYQIHWPFPPIQIFSCQPSAWRARPQI